VAEVRVEFVLCGGGEEPLLECDLAAVTSSGDVVVVPLGGTLTRFVVVGREWRPDERVVLVALAPLALERVVRPT